MLDGWVFDWFEEKMIILKVIVDAIFDDYKYTFDSLRISCCFSMVGLLSPWTV